MATYIIKKNNNSFLKVYLYINDFITIQEEEYNESYAIIKGIFRYEGNNGNNYAFVVVDWFENTEKEHPLLKYPIYSLQTKNWKQVFPIHLIENVQKVYFIKHDNRK